MTRTVRHRQTVVLEGITPGTAISTEQQRLRAVCNRTGWFVTDRIDPLIKDAMIRWDRISDSTTLSFVSRPASASGRSALDAVLWLSTTLGVSLPEIRKAVGIAERTYHDWKSNQRAPRLGSLGSLWSLVQVVEDLERIHSDVAAWFRADPELLAALRRGDFTYLASYDLSKRTVVSPTTGAPQIISAVGPEPEMPPLSPRRPLGRRITLVPTRTKRRGDTRSGSAAE